MARLIYVTGGARSGKSGFAQQLAREAEGPVTYIATAVACDEEMAERIVRHRQNRPADWVTVEAWQGLDRVIAETATPVILLDCMTVMVTNLLLDGAGIDWDNAQTLPPDVAQKLEDRVLHEVEALLAAARQRTGTIILVSNEVGLGLAPAYPLGRLFRDVAGRVNQRVAAAADEAWMLVSGLPLRLK